MRYAISTVMTSVLTVLASHTAVAQGSETSAYPERPIRLVSPFPAGGGTDYVARLLASRLGESGWTVTVDNRAGANGTIGVADIARARANGYELVIGQRDNLVFAPQFQSVPYDTVRDFQPIVYLARTPIIIVAAADGKYRNFAEVISAARAQPGSVSIGSSGHGSASHIASELLRTRGGVQLTHVPYRGSAPALAEFGFAGVEVQSWYGLFAPAGLSAGLTRKLHEQVSRVVRQPEVIALLHGQGLEPQAMSPDEFARFVRTDYQDIQTVLAETGIGQQ